MTSASRLFPVPTSLAPMGPVRQPPFRGTAPALVTPFSPDGEVDEAAFRRLIDRQIGGSAGPDGVVYAGVEAVVVMGTTGENPTVTDAERQRLVEIAVEHVAGRAVVVVGVGTNDTAQSARYARAAADAGADALLVVSPYYNKPTPDGHVAHVAAIADATDCPVILYNVPGRTGQNIPAALMLRIAEAVPSVAGVKEASGDLNQIADILAARPEGFAVYAGDDDLAFPTVCLGADGLISVAANALPGPVAEMVRLALAGDVAGARALHFALLRAMRVNFAEASPTPVKAVLAAMGEMAARVRLPLAPLTDATRALVMDAYAPFLGVAVRA